MSSSTIQRICPYLGLVGDPASHFSAPDRAHQCFSPSSPGDIENDYQQHICFSLEFAVCPRFVTPPVNAPAVPVGLPAKRGTNRALWFALLLFLILIPFAALIVLSGRLTPRIIDSAVVPPVFTHTAVARVAQTPQGSQTPSATRTPSLVNTVVPIEISTPPTGGAVFALVADLKQTGWISDQDANPHWGDPDLRAGVFRNQKYVGLLQFELTDLPPGSQILFATLELIGRDATHMGSGSWQIEMINLPPRDNGSSLTIDDILSAPALGTIGGALTAKDLAVGTPNRFAFDVSQRNIFEKQLNNGVLNFRIQGPAGGEDSLFAWEGSTSSSNNPPTLYVVAVPAALVVVTSTPTPANVLTAAADAGRATAFARQYGTPTRMRGIVTPTPGLNFVDVLPAPTPANTATAQYLNAYATAVAMTTGTFTPTPSNYRVVSPTPTPLVVNLAQLTPNPTATPVPTRSDLAAMSIPAELHGKIIAYSNRFLVPPATPTSPLTEDQAGEVAERMHFGANAPIVIDPDTGNVIGMLSTPDIYLAAEMREPFSPDRNRLAYVGSDADGNPQIFLLDITYNLRTRITSVRPNLTIANVAAYAPAWSPDGRQIVYVSNEWGTDDIYVYDLDTRITHRLTNRISPWNKHPSWSPDGKKIVFWSDRSGYPQLWIMSANGDNPVNLSHNDYNEMNPVWIK